MGGYYETKKVADVLGLPVTVAAMNVMVNGVHWHDHLEILLCKKGKLYVRVNGVEHRLDEGDFLTVNSGDSHEIYDGEPGNLQIVCSVHKEMLGDMQDKKICCATVGDGVLDCESGEVRRAAAGMGLPEKTLVRQALSEMAYLSVPDAGTEKEMGVWKGKKTQRESREELCRMHPLRQEENWNRYHMYMYQLLTVLVRHKEEGEKGKHKKHELLNACVSYIHTHMGEPLDAAALAVEMHVSESTVYRVFSSQMGMRLNQYIAMLRVNAACRYLEESANKVTDIAYSCGFTGLSNFYRVFRLYVGMTPKEYRSSRRHVGTRMMFWEPDIMKLNRYQSFDELGMEKEWLREPMP